MTADDERTVLTELRKIEQMARQKVLVHGSADCAECIEHLRWLMVRLRFLKIGEGDG